MKTCIKEGCNFPVFTHGYCKFHSYLHYKKDNPAKKERKKTGELELFNEIWNERPHNSFLTGMVIPDKTSPFWVSCFAHVLSKKQYSKARLDKDNIILLLPYEHYLLDNGTEKQREEYAKENCCNWKKIFTLKEFLKQRYDYEANRI